MIKLETKDYKQIINALESIQSSWEDKIVMDLSKDTILDYSNQFDDVQMGLRCLYINYRKSARVQTLTNDTAEDVMYDLWDIMTELNGSDIYDVYLKDHIKLCQAWLLLVKHTNSHINRRFNNDLDAKNSGLSVKHFIYVYNRDIKQMKYELNNYWPAIRDYGWGRVKFDKKDGNKGITIDK